MAYDVWCMHVSSLQNKKWMKALCSLTHNFYILEEDIDKLFVFEKEYLIPKAVYRSEEKTLNKRLCSC